MVLIAKSLISGLTFTACFEVATQRWVLGGLDTVACGGRERGGTNSDDWTETLVLYMYNKISLRINVPWN
jgi:hypothetical protein